MYQWLHYYFPTNNYLFKVIDKNSRAWCKICPKLTIKTSERHQWRHSEVFIINFEYISHHVLVYLLLLWATNYQRGYFFQANSVLQVVNDQSYLISSEIQTKQRSSRAWLVLVHFVDSLWFCLVPDGLGQFQIILWFLLFIWFIFSIYINTI